MTWVLDDGSVSERRARNKWKVEMLKTKSKQKQQSMIAEHPGARTVWSKHIYVRYCVTGIQVINTRYFILNRYLHAWMYQWRIESNAWMKYIGTMASIHISMSGSLDIRDLLTHGSNTPWGYFTGGFLNLEQLGEYKALKLPVFIDCRWGSSNFHFKNKIKYRIREYSHRRSQRCSPARE